jgi:hypothetical protein
MVLSASFVYIAPDATFLMMEGKLESILLLKMVIVDFLKVQASVLFMRLTPAVCLVVEELQNSRVDLRKADVRSIRKGLTS